MLRDRTAHPKADQEHVTKVSRLPSRDTTANAANPATAADRKAHPAAKLPDLDPPFLDPPDSEWPEPGWPDPAWPGFAPGRSSPSYAFTLAASPWFTERHLDKAANLWDALHAGKERHADPEPDLEAEP
jgi:hypothetical protein